MQHHEEWQKNEWQEAGNQTHQAKGNQPLMGDGPPAEPGVVRPDELVCKRWLGGPLKSYRKAG